MTHSTLKKQASKPAATTNIFDEELVNAIRDGKIVHVKWSQLTPEEQRAAKTVMFRPLGDW